MYVLKKSSVLRWLQKQDDDEDDDEEKSRTAADRELQAARPQHYRPTCMPQRGNGRYSAEPKNSTALIMNS